MSMIRRTRLLPCLAVALLVAAAGDPPAPGTVARRGEVRLSDTDLRETLNALDPGVRSQVTGNPQALRSFVQERVLNAAVMAEAGAKGWATRPDVARRAREAHDLVIVQTYLASLVPEDPAFPSETDVKAAYDANQARLGVPKQYHVAQVVLLVPRNATAREDEDIRKKALELRAQLTRKNADFADVARKNSQEKASAEKGGDVGWLRETELLPVVRDAVATLPENGLSQPVRAPDGWHVLKLLEVKPAGLMSFDDAKPQMVQALKQARAQRLIRKYLDEMLAAQPIQVNEIELGQATAPK